MCDSIESRTEGRFRPLERRPCHELSGVRGFPDPGTSGCLRRLRVSFGSAVSVRLPAAAFGCGRRRDSLSCSFPAPLERCPVLSDRHCAADLFGSCPLPAHCRTGRSDPPVLQLFLTPASGFPRWPAAIFNRRPTGVFVFLFRAALLFSIFSLTNPLADDTIVLQLVKTNLCSRTQATGQPPLLRHRDCFLAVPSASCKRISFFPLIWPPRGIPRGGALLCPERCTGYIFRGCIHRSPMPCACNSAHSKNPAKTSP